MDYQGNANKDKEPKPDKPQIEKVVTGDVIQKPKSIGHKFKEIFFGGDIKASARYVASDVLLPALRDIIVDVVSNGVKRMVYGESIYNRRTTTYGSRVQYNSPVNRALPMGMRPRANLPDQPHPARMQRVDQDNIVLARKEDAELVVERLIDIINQYEVASRADLYDLIGLSSSHIDNKWGWTYLNNVEVRQVREGYLIDLPQLEPI